MADPADGAKGTGKLLLREEIRAEFLRALAELIRGKNKWLDEAVGSLYRREYELHFKHFNLLRIVLHADNLSAPDQECIDFVALEHAKIATGKPLNELEKSEIDQVSFNLFCQELEKMVLDAMIDDNNIDVPKAHAWLRGRRWIEQGFLVKRIILHVAKLKNLSSALNTFISACQKLGDGIDILLDEPAEKLVTKTADWHAKTESWKNNFQNK